MDATDSLTKTRPRQTQTLTVRSTRLSPTELPVRFDESPLGKGTQNENVLLSIEREATTLQ